MHTTCAHTHTQQTTHTHTPHCSASAVVHTPAQKPSSMLARLTAPPLLLLPEGHHCWLRPPLQAQTSSSTPLPTSFLVTSRQEPLLPGSCPAAGLGAAHSCWLELALQACSSTLGAPVWGLGLLALEAAQRPGKPAGDRVPRGPEPLTAHSQLSEPEAPPQATVSSRSPAAGGAQAGPEPAAAAAEGAVQGWGGATSMASSSKTVGSP
jgi:hypothetical protein